MTPQEKAKELVDKYFELYIDNHTCKKFALIAVDEILSECRYLKEDLTIYWLEVKNEIEKL